MKISSSVFLDNPVENVSDVLLMEPIKTLRIKINVVKNKPESTNTYYNDSIFYYDNPLEHYWCYIQIGDTITINDDPPVHIVDERTLMTIYHNISYLLALEKLETAND